MQSRTSGNIHLEVEAIHRRDVVARMAYLSEDGALHGVVDSSACIETIAFDSPKRDLHAGVRLLLAQVRDVE